MHKNEKIVVCGAGGFIGGHLIADLRGQGFGNLRAVDIKPLKEWYQRFPDVENLILNLQEKDACYRALQGAAYVYNLAADMGGMGFIENNRALCMLSVLINIHLLMRWIDELTFEQSLNAAIEDFKQNYEKYLDQSR